MKQVVVDTNALISFVTDRNLRQQAKVSELFHKAAQLKVMVLCPQNVITDFVYVLDKVYGIDRYQIKTIIHDFVSMPGIAVIHELDLKTVLTIWPETLADFGDAVVASVCGTNQHNAVMTFDKAFIKKLKSMGIAVST